MCVIAIAETERMTADQVGKMFKANRDGAGFAYREHGKVQWRKGLDEDEITDLCLTAPVPYVAHFRIASCGGVKPELTHPFPIQRDAPLALKGSTTGSVLFHNGHYHRWKDELKTMCVSGQIKLPKGPWSDTRLMAWVASYCGVEILPFFEEKLVDFSLDDIEVWGTGWTRVDNLYVSNRSWEHTHVTYGNVITVCRFGQCKKDRVNGTTFCEDHQGGVETTAFMREKNERAQQGVALVPKTFRRGDGNEGTGPVEQETVEEISQSLGEGSEEGEEFPSDASLSEREEAINWVRRLNPRAYRTPPRLM